MIFLFNNSDFWIPCCTFQGVLSIPGICGISEFFSFLAPHRFSAQDACFSQKFRCDHYQGAGLFFLGQGCGCCINGLLQTVTTGQVEMAVPV